MKKFIPLLLILAVGLGFTACEDLVNDVDDPIDTISDGQLNTESQVSFLINGLNTRFSTTYDRIALQAGGLSDEQIFDTNVPNATFPTFRQIDDGEIELDNNSVDGLYNDVGELRFFSDNLLERLAEIEFTDTALRQEAEYYANLYGGIARYFYAAYFGLSETEGGGVIDAGPFIPSSDMYDQALAKLNEALSSAPSAYETKVVNTIIARIHLIRGNYSAADAALANALESGDAPFQSLHSVESSNEWWANSGRGRTQFVADFRFATIVANEPEEANRIVLTTKLGNDETTVYYFQDLYPEAGSPLPFATWQEADLMRAEIALNNSDPGTAETLIDAVRASHGISPLGSAPVLDDLIEERERELFTMGLRLVDQRRFDLWHLPAGTWQYLPITQSERNQNENL